MAWGLLNMAGGEITAFQYDDINSVGKNKHFIYRASQTANTELLTIRCAVRLEPEFNMLYAQTGSGYFQIQQNGLLGIADTDGRLLVPAIYYELDLSGFSLSKLDKKEFIFPITDILAVGSQAVAAITL
ncbi:MAG: WG repeat-containing protein [Saprospiraceae bacterium]